MVYYNDSTGHFHVWVPFHRELDLMTCQESTIYWPLHERKGSWLHRLVLRIHRFRIC